MPSKKDPQQFFLACFALVSVGFMIIALLRGAAALSLLSDSLFTKGWIALSFWGAMFIVTMTFAIFFSLRLCSQGMRRKDDAWPTWSDEKEPRMWHKLQQRIKGDDSEPE